MRAIRFSIKAETIDLPQDFDEADIEFAKVLEYKFVLHFGVDIPSNLDNKRLLVLGHTLQEVAGEVLAGMQLITER